MLVVLSIRTNEIHQPLHYHKHLPHQGGLEKNFTYNSFTDQNFTYNCFTDHFFCRLLTQQSVMVRGLWLADSASATLVTSVTGANVITLGLLQRE